MADPDLRCPACGGANSLGAAYCRGCGRALPAQTMRFDPVAEDDADQTVGALPPVRGRLLVVQNGPLKGSRLELTRSEVGIGRDPGCDVFLDDITVSRHHASIRAGSRGDTIADSGSLNGTYVNGARVESSSLASGDVVQIGRYRLVYMRRQRNRDRAGLGSTLPAGDEGGEAGD